METFVSLASGWSGGLPGTGRPSASFSSASGRAFSEELERAREEQEGTGLEADRRAEAQASRRTSRRASFGAETSEEARTPTRASEPEPSTELAAGALSRGEVASRAPDEAPTPDASEMRPAATAATAGGDDAPASTGSALPAPTASAPGPGTLPVAVAPERAPLAVSALAPAAAAAAAEPAPLAPLSSRAPTARPALPGSAAEVPGQATQARAEEVLRQVELHLAAGVKRLTFELEPLELGRLSIQLALRGGKVAAIVRGERPETLELLRAREADLKRLLAERGVVADGVRFELGFRTPSEARHARPSTSTGSGRAPRATGGPVSFDTYA